MTDRRLLRTGAVITASAGAVGALSYTGNLVLAHLLPVGEYTEYSAAQSMLGTVGVVAAALVPLPLSPVVRAHAARSAQRRDGVGFALLVALLGGVVAAVLLSMVGLGFAGAGMACMIGVAAFAVFAVSPVWGWLQGESRFALYAAASIGEVLLRLVFTLAALAVGLGAVGAVGGFAVGALLVLLVEIALMHQDVRPRFRVLSERERWRETGAVASVQFTVSALVGADVVLVAVLAGDSAQGAGYQALATLAKGPVYVAASVALVGFPLLKGKAVGASSDAIARSMLRSFVRLALPVTAVVATTPAELVLAVLPDRYVGAVGLLPWLAVVGLGFGAISVVSMLLLGVGLYRRCRLGLVAAAALVLGALGTGWLSSGTTGLAVGGCVGTVAAAAVCAVSAKRFLVPAARGVAMRAIGSALLLVTALTVARGSIVVWSAVVLVAAVVALLPRRGPAPRHGDRMTVLHLGFEDPAMPGAGGGSLRTHEINKRLVAAGHDVTVLVTRYPGSQDRIEDGVRYVHVGPGKGRTSVGRVLAYALALPIAVRRYEADLVVEDFFAPISTMAAPLWTSHPTVGVVQWLNAREKSRQYRLPFHLVERFGVRRHRRLIAVSQGVADRLTGMNPEVRVEVIGNGVDPRAFTASGAVGDDVVYVGRLEIAQKGLDLLLRAWAAACPHLTGSLVVAGTGPDERKLRSLAAELGIGHRIRFAGWISGPAKYDLLASARLAVVPSRFETFGIVAVEALACGTPVLAFDIPCLREVVPAHSGELVAPFDIDAYAEAMVRLCRRHRADHDAARARRFVAAYDWDALACQQEAFYRHTVHGIPVTDPRAAVRAQLTGLGRHRAQGRPPRLVVIGNVGNGNTGDEALLTATLAALDTDAKPTVLSRNPERVTALHGVPALPMKPGSALRALHTCDAVVVVGGGMFGPGLPPLVRLLPHLVAALRLTGRDTVYAGIGVYPGVPDHVLGQLRRAASRGYVTVRDRLSVDTLALTVTVPCVGDLAWHVEPAPRNTARHHLDVAGVNGTRPLLLLSPKAGVDNAQTSRMVDLLAAAARKWEHHGGTVAAIALSDRADHGRGTADTDTALAARIATRSDMTIPVVGPNLAPAVAKAITAEADAVLGLRFHALVFALGTRTPCAGFPWEPKTQALIDQHQLPTVDDGNFARWLDSILTPTPLRR